MTLYALSDGVCPEGVASVRPEGKAEEVPAMKWEMTKSERSCKRRNGEKGITLLECAVILVLIALAVASFNAGFTATLSSLFTRVITALG